MKYRFFIIIVFSLSKCATVPPQPKEVIIEPILILKDSSHYANGQLAYKKENNIIKFYNYKGALKKTFNLNTRIERSYNLIGETFRSGTSMQCRSGAGYGYYSYPDAILIPKGRRVSLGEVGTGATAEDQVIPIEKNNLGYPSVMRLNKFGQITQDADEKRIFDSLGRIMNRKFYNGDEKPYKTIEFIYNNGSLEKAIHTGINKEYNFIKEYFFDDKNTLFKEIFKRENTIQSITFYSYDKNLLQTKETYYQYDETSIALELHKYTYDDKNRCINDKYYEYYREKNLTMNDIVNLTKLSISKKNTPSPISTDFIFEGDNFIGIKKTNFRYTPPEIIENSMYVYNEFNQLIETKDLLKDEVWSFNLVYNN